MKRNAEDGENAEEETRSRNNGKTAGLFLISCLPDQKMLHRSGFAIPRRPLRLCGYLDSSDGRGNRRGAEEEFVLKSVKSVVKNLPFIFPFTLKSVSNPHEHDLFSSTWRSWRLGVLAVKISSLSLMESHHPAS